MGIVFWLTTEFRYLVTDQRTAKDLPRKLKENIELLQHKGKTRIGGSNENEDRKAGQRKKYREWQVTPEAIEKTYRKPQL